MLINIVIVIGFLTGLIMMASSIIQKKKLSKTSMIIVTIPVSLLTLALLFNWLHNLLSYKPANRDLVGRYHLSDVTVSDFDASTSKDYYLNFYADGSFHFSVPSNSNLICENGRYDLSYELDDNEIQLDCGSTTTFIHINRGLRDFNIELIVGDPDSGESYYFEKDTK